MEHLTAEYMNERLHEMDQELEKSHRYYLRLVGEVRDAVCHFPTLAHWECQSFKVRADWIEHMTQLARAERLRQPNWGAF